MNTIDAIQTAQASILERTVNAADDTNDTHATPRSVMVVGASGGIGQAFCEHIHARFPAARVIRVVRNTKALPARNYVQQDIAIDLEETTSIQTAVEVLDAEQLAQLDWVFIATGWLHDDNWQPEKTYRSLDAAHMQRAYAINTIGPTLFIQHLLNRLPRTHALKIGVLSARVGSISDNRLGGWHSYRASKAALNMLIKNYAIELRRLRRPVTVVGLQPGTTATALSAPFQRNVAEGHLQTPDYTADQLIQVMQALQPEDTGQLFDFLGLTFAP